MVPNSKILPTLPLLLPPLLWPLMELYTTRGFDAGLPTYSFQIESLSDLGIDYMQIHPLKHYAVTSYFYRLQNGNFIFAGLGIAAGQALMLLRGGRNGTVRNLRLMLAALFGVGMVLIGVVHGGPREKVWGVIGWHWMGWGMVAVAGGLNAILAAAAPTAGTFETNKDYRFVSFVLGVAALVSLYQFQTLGKWNFQTKIGLWQRGMVYPALVWNALTAIEVLFSRKGVANVKGKKA